MKLAIVYAGQGSQHPGMGRDVYEAFPAFREAFDAAREQLGFDLHKVCFEDPDGVLNETQYTQPCMVAFAAGLTAVLKEMGIVPDLVAGLSLGEYSALAAAGGLETQTAISLAAFRGKAMEEAAAGHDSAMVAVLGFPRAQLLEAVRESQSLGTVVIANYNCPGQIVITGLAEAVAEASEKLKAAGGRRVIPLNVSGPFHSAMLATAGKELGKVLEGVTLHELKIPYVTNVTAEYVEDPAETKALLEKQISSSVRWQQSVENMIRQGVDTFIEIGPGRTLAGFMRKIDRNVKVYNIQTVEDAEKVCQELV